MEIPKGLDELPYDRRVATFHIVSVLSFALGLDMPSEGSQQRAATFPYLIRSLNPQLDLVTLAKSDF